MLKLKLKKQSGFTLIELLIVVIIVSVLAAVTMSLLQGNVARARLTEADAALGTIRTAMRAQFAEFAAFPDIGDGTAVTATNIGFNPGDLTGRFFEDDDFVFATVEPGNAAAVPPIAPAFCVRVTGDAVDGLTPLTTAARGNQVNNISRSMNEVGSIFNNANCADAGLVN